MAPWRTSRTVLYGISTAVHALLELADGLSSTSGDY